MIRVKNRVGEVRYNNQGEKMTIIAYRGCKDIDVQFEDGVIIYNRNYGKFKEGKMKHPIRYEESIAYHIEVELGLNLDDIWNWELNDKNRVNPYETTKCSGKKIWLYCQEKDYHNDYGGYEIRCDSFYKGGRCGYCNSRQRVHYKDSLAYNYPEIAKMIAIEENNLTFEDCYKISRSSGKKFYFKCLDCGMVSDKEYSLNAVNTINYSCRYCSDGISIPNKFMANVLKQLNEYFVTELNKSDFEWCGYFKYDFYIPKYNMIIEMNGEQHYRETYSKWDNLEKIQMNDLFKYKCAKGHVDNYIVIDCRYSTLEWLKENIVKELGKYFDLNKTDWELAWEESQNSLCIKTWELWDSGIYDTKKISYILDLSRSTIIKYLKRGEEINRCSYTKEHSLKMRKR